MFHSHYTNDSIFVFTDGAITKGHSSGSAVYGIPIIDENDNLELTKVRAWSKFHNSSTNNEAELTGIWAGIQHASQDHPERNLCVFSDSEYCVKTLTHWIFDWYKTYTLNKRNGIVIPSMMTKGGTPVKNAQLICLIINYIVSNNINVKFINVKGHASSVEEQINYFKKANYFVIEKRDARFLNKYNHIVDRVAVIVSNFIKNNGIEGVDPRNPYIEFEQNGLTFRVEDSSDEENLFGQYYLLNNKIMKLYKDILSIDPFS